MAWKGIIGKAFSTEASFAQYVDSVQFGLWRPRFVVVHNTSAPDAKTYQKHWDRPTPITDEQWMRNLEGYYRDEQRWSAGPHLFVTPRNICVFTPLNMPGVHTPSWNAISWGVETVGEFQYDKYEGPIKGNLIAALAVLHAKAGLQLMPWARGQRGLHFHKEDPNTTHKACPGRNLNKAVLISDVGDHIKDTYQGEHFPGAVR